MTKLSPPHGLRIVLISGLSIRRRNSFTLQIDLLAQQLKGFGCQCRILGRSPSASASAANDDDDDSLDAKPEQKKSGAIDRVDLLDLSEELVKSAIRDFAPDATILLGYPDQFAFLKESEYRPGLAYLWAQFSHIPTGLPRALTIIPLTRKSAEFAEPATSAAGSAIGPVVPHGVDLEVFDAGGIGNTGDRFGLPTMYTVGIVATNQPRKRLDRFLDTCYLARGRIPSIHFCIKTDRSKAAGGFDLPLEITNRGIEESVTIIDDSPSGRGLTKHDLARLYSCFDLYLHTSEWEGFGIPAIEAMASGVPVATHRGQGPGEFTPYPELEIESTEVIDDSGAVLNYIDPESAVTVVERLINQKPDERLDYSTRGERIAREFYEAPGVAAAWIDIITRDLTQIEEKHGGTTGCD